MSRRRQAERALIDPRAPMPTFARVRQRDPAGFRAMVTYLASLK
jgi:hypothetical protein